MAIGRRYTAYSEKENMTFIMYDKYKDNDLVSTECVGWYHGEPNEEDTEKFSGSLKAYYDYEAEKETNKNATLVINNTEQFQNDIWNTTTSGNWKKEEWIESIKYQSQTLQNLYNELESSEEYGCGCDQLYVLGDIINLLNSIDINVK